MKQALQLKVRQQQNLSPRLQQAIRLLQLSTSELDLEIQQALDANPILELNDDYEEYNYHKEHNTIEPITYLSSSTSLHEYLAWQLMLSPFNARDKIIATTIIDYIDDEGYLTIDLEEIKLILCTQYYNLSPIFDLDEILMVLHRIQQFDPLGIGARSLQECLILQINSATLTPQISQLCIAIIQNHLELIARKDSTTLKKIYGISDDTLEVCLHAITSTNPKPGLIFSCERTEYITPDAYVKCIDGRWQVFLQYHHAQHLKINSTYAALMQQKKSIQDVASIRQMFNEAKWFIESIKQRNLTLLNVATWVIQQQQDFLNKGEMYLRPLTLQDVAVALDMSESTVCRITNKKYIHTPRGIYELKFFFSNGILNSDGDLYSSNAIKALIKNLITAEDPKKPLSDQAITNLITQQGICIARRTVTKYREALGILASNQRGI